MRPTPDRVRETVFNWLHGSLVGARCLDLFAGTGVLGFEALSRGAAEAWFVEQDAKLVDALRTTARQLGVAPQIVRRDALAFLREPPAARFDVVFLDPPYAAPLDPLLAVLPPWLAPHGARLRRAAAQRRSAGRRFGRVAEAELRRRRRVRAPAVRSDTMTQHAHERSA